MRKLFTSLVIVSLVASAVAQQQRAPEGATVLRDVEYSPQGHDRHKLDLLVPRGEGPFPVIVWVHGGAWRAGSKGAGPAIGFVDKGYAVASINYRLSQHAIFPAQIEDCKTAIRWLRANAEKYKLDGQRFGVWGSSAGGHLVALLGAAGDVKDWDAQGGHADHSSRVQCVVDWFGPTDFLQMGGTHNAANSPESLLVGGAIQEHPEKVAKANPINYATPDDPPFLIVHGELDRTVPPNQSELLTAALKKAGVAVEHRVIPGAGHGGPAFSSPDNLQVVAQFLERHLKQAADTTRRNADSLPQASGYRGIWYMNQPSGDQYKYKYSGGMATYPQQHAPIAIYSPQAHKTFFCYGGTVEGKQELLHMISYVDHATGMLPKPRILLNKKTDDAHDNPTLCLDDAGHLWIFSSAHGTARPSYIHRSVRPYDIDAFERVQETNFSYTQPWHVPGEGFLFLHTRYAQGRGLFWMTSRDGRQWNPPQPLAKIGMGDYQISWPHRSGTRIGTAFDYHPAPQGLNARTNLYYLETRDFGRSWRTITGQQVQTPLTERNNPALIRDYESEGLLVYLKDLNFDGENPVILYLTSKGYASGPQSGPRAWHTARWTGDTWEIRPFATSDHNYDHGSLDIAGTTWTIVAPTEPGPQPFGTGGEMVLWQSERGVDWVKKEQLTRESVRNHTYVRRPLNAHADFAWFWADGDAFKPSESRLHFSSSSGEQVWRLPARMDDDFAKPELMDSQR